ncbi:MAG: hypothetical protein ACFB15_09050 [Cyclobacteriaceae bacterium]
MAELLELNESLYLAIRQNLLEQIDLLRRLETVLSRRFNEGKLLIIKVIFGVSSGEVEFIE